MEDPRNCSFCGKDKNVVRHLFVHFEKRVAICDGCVSHCATVMISNPENAGVGQWFLSQSPPLQSTDLESLVRGVIAKQKEPA